MSTAPSTPYSDLRVIRRFRAGHKSAGAYLLENNIVKKTYDLDRAKHRRRFKLEVKHLKHLRHCDFVPKVLDIDKPNGTIYMTYCGSRPAETPENIKRNAELVKRLYYEWSMARKSVTKPRFRTSLQNNAIQDNKLYLIDFGSSNWICFKKGRATP